jgi:hypothetical protein
MRTRMSNEVEVDVPETSASSSEGAPSSIVCTIPCSVTSYTQARASASGNPSTSSSVMSRIAHAGTPNGGTRISASWRRTKETPA